MFRGGSSQTDIRRLAYRGFAALSGMLACGMLVLVGNPVRLVTATAVISLAAAPFLYGFNLYCVRHHIENPRLQPSQASVWVAYAGILFMLIALGCTLYVKIKA